MNRRSHGCALRSVLMALVACLAGCSGLVSTSSNPLSGHHYVLAILTSGTRANELDEAARAAATAGHRARINSMGAEGTLLLAGPFGEPRGDENWRGIYVFDLSDTDEAYELARTDPAIEAGLFDLLLMPWHSNVDLRPMRAHLEKAKAAGEPFVPAAYVLAIGEPAERVLDVLPRLLATQEVICAGELGGRREGQFLLLLKAETVDDARKLLDLGDSPVRWNLSSFWATSLLGQQVGSPGRVGENQD